MKAITVPLKVALFLALSGCFRCCGSPEYRTPDELAAPMMPVSEYIPMRRQYTPYSLKFRLAVLNFVDQTGAAGQLVKTIPDVLTTGIYDTSRFDLLDRGQLREKTTNEVEQEREQLSADGLLQGAITQIRPDQNVIVCDIRVTNRFTNAVMYAKSAEIRYTGTIDVTLERGDVQVLSREIADSFPKLDDNRPAKILEINGDTVTISAGADRNIRTGVTALVQASGGSLLKDIDSGDILTSHYYVGQVSVISVLERTSKAQIGGRGEVRVGDTVILK